MRKHWVYVVCLKTTFVESATGKLPTELVDIELVAVLVTLKLMAAHTSTCLKAY